MDSINDMSNEQLTSVKEMVHLMVLKVEYFKILAKTPYAFSPVEVVQAFNEAVTMLDDFLSSAEMLAEMELITRDPNA